MIVSHVCGLFVLQNDVELNPVGGVMGLKVVT